MKIFKTIWNIITTIFVVAAAAAAVLLVGVRIFGLTPYTVLSGSMEPTYHVGSLIYVRKVPADEIAVGDPITFVLNEELVVATHRVIEIDAQNELFRTKGDNNESPDASPVSFKNVLGVPQFTIPYLGYLSNFITKPVGWISCGAGIVILLLISFIPDIVGGEKGKRKPRGRRREISYRDGGDKK
ncbi:MAG: signal peptidase I [Eubacteriales bacterium]